MVPVEINEFPLNFMEFDGRIDKYVVWVDKFKEENKEHPQKAGHLSQFGDWEKLFPVCNEYTFRPL